MDTHQHLRVCNNPTISQLEVKYIRYIKTLSIFISRKKLKHLQEYFCVVNIKALHTADHITVYKVEEQRANILQAQHQEPVCYPLKILNIAQLLQLQGQFILYNAGIRSHIELKHYAAASGLNYLDQICHIHRHFIYLGTVVLLNIS